jgi:hypothetical protein
VGFDDGVDNGARATPEAARDVEQKEGSLHYDLHYFLEDKDKLG